MTAAQLRRLAWFALLAVTVALGMIATTRAADGDGEYIVIIDPRVTFCQSLEPYGWWYYFHNCHEILHPSNLLMTAEPVILDQGRRVIVIEIRSTVPDSRTKKEQ